MGDYIDDDDDDDDDNDGDGDGDLALRHLLMFLFPMSSRSNERLVAPNLAKVSGVLFSFKFLFRPCARRSGSCYLLQQVYSSSE